MNTEAIQAACMRAGGFRITITTRDLNNDDLLVLVDINGYRETVRVPAELAPFSSLVTQRHIDAIAAELARRRRDRLLANNRHDHFKGFRA